MDEFILCAAIYDAGYIPKDGKEIQHQAKNIDKGLVVYGPRHSHCFELYSKIVEYKDVKHNLITQGFLTSKQRFVDRKEAWTIAKYQGQLIKNQNRDCDELYSEDLY